MGVAFRRYGQMIWLFLALILFLVLPVLGTSLGLLYFIVYVPYATTTKGDANDDVYPRSKAISLHAAPHLNHALGTIAAVSH